jgi:polysaccharide pyruvyl transferase WcaK-like protein
MNLTELLHQTNLENSLLIGYYGGGNYGDELLLEVLGNLLKRQGVQNVAITYQRPATYRTMHHDFGYRTIDIHSKPALIAASLRSRTILIGGGGLWGVDMNFNTFLLGVYLFFCRFVLMKKVYLLGIGFYNSTTRQGRIAAWFAGKAANAILARDRESADNFRKISKHVHQDTDIAWQAQNLDLSAYKVELAELTMRLPITGKTLLLALRRPQAKRQKEVFVRFNQHIAGLISDNPNRPILLVMLESEGKDPELYAQARAWQKHHKHLRILEAPYNPLTLYLFVKEHHKRLCVIAPQLHLIMTAHLTGTLYMPMGYDNKVRMLLEQIGVPAAQQIAVSNITKPDLQTFADNFFGGSA